jgi:hypothetical protein
MDLKTQIDPTQWEWENLIFLYHQWVGLPDKKSTPKFEN